MDGRSTVLATEYRRAGEGSGSARPFAGLRRRRGSRAIDQPSTLGGRTTGRQPPLCRPPTATNRPLSTANRHRQPPPLPSVDRQPPSVDRQPPPIANRNQPPSVDRQSPSVHHQPPRAPFGAILGSSEATEPSHPNERRQRNGPTGPHSITSQTTQSSVCCAPLFCPGGRGRWSKFVHGSVNKIFHSKMGVAWTLFAHFRSGC